MSAFLPYGTQWIEEDDIAAVVDVLRNGHLTQGPKVLAFEAAIASYVGAKFCLAFGNATEALQAAVKALDLPAGSNGLTSPNTFVASANCLAYNGLVPRFADIDPDTFNVTAATLRKAIDPATSVLIPVHFAGQACDMGAIGSLARERKLPVIEDAAHAIGSTYADGSRVGCCRESAMTVFSFHPVKTMTTGEGGAITTNDPLLFQRLQLLRSHGITKDPNLLSANPGPWYYEQQELGYNFRITDLQCALGLSQLSKLDRYKARRREIVAAYNRAFQGIRGVRTPHEAPGLESCFHLYVLQIDFAALGKDRASVMKELVEKGVGSQVLYIPVHTQPWYRRTFGYGPGDFPIAEAYYQRALSIPLFPRMGTDDVERVVAAVQSVLA
jgi:UDP-4-amino-4,6-dideoxy-N-acetyl-beta-L-altrosamine transaminase